MGVVTALISALCFLVVHSWPGLPRIVALQTIFPCVFLMGACETAGGHQQAAAGIFHLLWLSGRSSTGRFQLLICMVRIISVLTSEVYGRT